jgi:hypothetical protein
MKRGNILIVDFSVYSPERSCARRWHCRTDHAMLST